MSSADSLDVALNNNATSDDPSDLLSSSRINEEGETDPRVIYIPISEPEGKKLWEQLMEYATYSYPPQDGDVSQDGLASDVDPENAPDSSSGQQGDSSSSPFFEIDLTSTAFWNDWKIEVLDFDDTPVEVVCTDFYQNFPFAFDNLNNGARGAVLQDLDTNEDELCVSIDRLQNLRVSAREV